MKHLMLFNERLGISTSLVEQAKIIIEFLQKSNSDSLQCYLTNELGNFPFVLEIEKIKGTAVGNFKISGLGECSIRISNRDDVATLLHEMKHYDMWIRKKDRAFDRMHHAVVKSTDRTVIEILYSFDHNEFESKFHGYYIDVDNYILKNISRNPGNEEIRNLVIAALQSGDDGTFRWWIKKGDIKFSDFLTKREINIAFYKILKESNLIWDPNIFKFYKNEIVDKYNSLRVKLGLFTKKERVDIDKLVLKYENEINKRKKKYKSKFSRLFTIMNEKWVK